ncbi:CHAP domain-containing protein [Streptomyces longwoodensis]|uniref:CHAP domain-containing protein n=1 Tax=Streptomyces longwoodensis TaxID=68231 RepID=UPI003814EE2F
MYDIKSVLQLAQSQVGYHEGKTGAHWNNKQKYAGQTPTLAWADGQAWCATFVNWCLYQAGIKVPAGAITASCAQGVAAYKKVKRFTEYPVVGAQVFYGAGGGSHTGIVLKYDDTYVWAVEGNTNTNGSAEGDGVYVKKRERRDPYVYGYGLPYYENDRADTPDPVWRNKPLGR